MKKFVLISLMAIVASVMAVDVRADFQSEQNMQGGYGLGVCLAGETNAATGEPSLQIALRHNIQPIAFGAGNPIVAANARLRLGELRLYDFKTAAVQTPETTRVSQIYAVCAFGKDKEGVALKATVTRLSPALLVELDDCEAAVGTDGINVGFFASDKTGWVDQELLDKLIKGYGARSGEKWGLGRPKPPRYYAWCDDSGKVSLGKFTGESLPLTGADKGWLLTWYGRDAWFPAGPTERANNLMWSHARDKAGLGFQLEPGDAPMLFVFSDDPGVMLEGDSPNEADAGTGPDGALVFNFFDAAAKIVMMPLYGCLLPSAATTRKWSEDGTLPQDVKAACDRLAGLMSRFPVELSESFSYDPAADAVDMGAKFEFLEVRPGGAEWAPLPPMLDLARICGFPITVSGNILETGVALYCGPYTAVEGAAEYTARITGLGKYAWENAVPAGALPAGAAGKVAAELRAEVEKAVAAGSLAPVFLPMKNSPGWTAYRMASFRNLYSEPGQELRVLAQSMPFLEEAAQTGVKEYLRAERKTFPPETVAHLPSNLNRREPYILFDGFAEAIQTDLRDFNFHIRTGTAPAQALYDLACYYAVMGAEEMTKDGFDLNAAIEKTVGPWLKRAEWATLGWYSWPYNLTDDREQGSGTAPDKARQGDIRDPQAFGVYGWNMTIDVNRQIAGLIGMARLARMAGDTEKEQMALTRLFVALAHRYALGKYTGWLYSRPGFLFQPEGFDTMNDQRDVAISEDHAIIVSGREQCGRLPFDNDGDGPYMAMPSELSRFTADFLKPEAQSFARLSETYYPDAYLTLGSPPHLTEWFHNWPENTWQIFMLQARILGAEPEFLRRRLDVPLVPIGDWYHIEKLAATLCAYTGVKWEEAGK